MKKYFYLFLMVGLFFTKQIKALEDSVYFIDKGVEYKVEGNEVFISPNQTSKVYSFEMRNKQKTGQFNRGFYYLTFNNNLNNNYEYRKVKVISQLKEEEYLLSSYSINPQIYFEVESEFYLIFEAKVSGANNKTDIYSSFNLTCIDQENDINIVSKKGKNVLINKKVPKIELSLENDYYGFSFTNDASHSYFNPGIYSMSFNYECSNGLNFSYQKMVITTPTFTKEIEMELNDKGYYQFNFSINEFFYIYFEGKNINVENEKKLMFFKNFKLKDLANLKPVLSIIKTGSIYTTNTSKSTIEITPTNDKTYKFKLQKSLLDPYYSSGDYTLLFDYILKSSANNGSDFKSQELILVGKNDERRINLSFTNNGNLEKNFNVEFEFYIEIEIKINNFGVGIPLDTYQDIKLKKNNIDIIRPSFINYEGIYLSDIDNPIDIADIYNALSAIDETDGDISEFIITIKDDYSNNKNKLGLHEVVFSVTDSSNNETRINIIVSVIDITPPTIINHTNFTCFISKGCYLNNKLITSQNINELLIVNDNVDNNFIFQNTDKNWFEQTPSYFDNYSITMVAKDLSNNISLPYTININYIDDIKPIIVEGGEIHSGNSKKLTINEIKTLIKIKNNFLGTKETQIQDGGQYLNLIENNYFENENIVGTYYVKFSYEEEELTCLIKVIDDIPPVFFTNEKIIYIDDYLNLNQEQIVNMLFNIGILEFYPSSYNFIVDEYTNNKNSNGSKYMMVLNAYYDNDTMSSIEFSLEKFIKNEEEDLISEEKENKNFFQKIWISILNFFKKIGIFFSNLFKKK